MLLLLLLIWLESLCGRHQGLAARLPGHAKE
jgi:hypothetical protein